MMSAPYYTAVFALGAFVFSAGVTYTILRWRPFLDWPNPRSAHAVATPRGGGIGIVVASLAGLLALQLWVEGARMPSPGFAGFVAGALAIAAVGLIDDIRALAWAPKLLAQALAVVFLLAGGAHFETLYVPGVGPIALGQAGWLVTFVWALGLANAYNFMDGLDGLAAGTGVLSGLALALVALALGAHPVAGGAVLVAAASAGFLLFNLAPARIFMGDVGSLFLGFAFAGLAVFLAAHDKSGLLIYLGPLVLFHFVFDTVVTFVRRLLRGENIAAAHKSHLYQRLNQSGWSHTQVSLAHYAMSLVQGACALWLAWSTSPAALAGFVVVLGVQIVYAGYVGRKHPIA